MLHAAPTLEDLELRSTYTDSLFVNHRNIEMWDLGMQLSMLTDDRVPSSFSIVPHLESLTLDVHYECQRDSQSNHLEDAFLSMLETRGRNSALRNVLVAVYEKSGALSFTPEQTMKLDGLRREDVFESIVVSVQREHT